MAQNGENNQDDIHRQLVNLLLEKIQSDPYPSVTMMDMLEEILQPDERPAYAAVLMDKIRGDQFPSLDMIARARDAS